MSLMIVTPAVTQPLTIDEVKRHLRIDVNDDDIVIAPMLAAGVAHVENHISGALMTQTWDMFLDEWPEDDMIALPKPPLQSVTSIQYTPDGGVLSTFASSNYIVDTASTPGRIVLNRNAAWPTDTLQAANGVVIRFVCGYTSAANVPGPIKHALKLLLGDMYENREDTLVGQGYSAMPLPLSAKSLLSSYRNWSF